MQHLQQERSYRLRTLMVIMDCRVKPGNDRRGVGGDRISGVMPVDPGIQAEKKSLFVKPGVTPPCGRLSAFGTFEVYFCQSRATAIECSRFNDEESALA
jgi:hypothetical protein